MSPHENILGLPFFSGSVEDAIRQTILGGLVVAPSGPNLAGELQAVASYRNAVLKADVVLTDSAVMVAAYRLQSGRAVPRHSGLKFLQALLSQPELREEKGVFWVMPSVKESQMIGQWLRQQGLQADEGNTYVAPFYSGGAIEDEILLSRLRMFQPRVVVINLAGGKQAVLGAWLASRLHPLPGLVCTGAAIAFLAGTQAGIPQWADRSGLGWLFRCLSGPRKFVPRYWKALRLIPLVLRYGSALPPAK